MERTKLFTIWNRLKYLINLQNFTAELFSCEPFITKLYFGGYPFLGLISVLFYK